MSRKVAFLILLVLVLVITATGVSYLVLSQRQPKVVNTDNWQLFDSGLGFSFKYPTFWSPSKGMSIAGYLGVDEGTVKGENVMVFLDEERRKLPLFIVSRFPGSGLSVEQWVQKYRFEEVKILDKEKTIGGLMLVGGKLSDDEDRNGTSYYLSRGEYFFEVLVWESRDENDSAMNQKMLETLRFD